MEFFTLLYIVIISIALAAFFVIENRWIQVSKYEFKSSKLHDKQECLRIVHLSDFHNKRFSKNQEYLINKIKAQYPDIIVITGDLISRSTVNITSTIQLLNGIKNLAHVYYVSGNHEANAKSFEELLSFIKNNDISFHDDSTTIIHKGSNSIELIGMKDLLMDKKLYYSSTKQEIVYKTLSSLIMKSNNLKILIVHRPELIDVYSMFDIDLILCGHAHGGQFRIPFIGGLYTPAQGLFPKYTSGVHKHKQSTMIISRGLGNTRLPIRIFNRPQIVVVDIRA